ncbi:hypothetical protein PoMZ_08963 [Pyricularia oryzae]|uniref:Uncharacterized protein n=1 Tax=Pyricularia oryzae TaxID=318829 RepID=A0A4P7MSS2_PYROR|nr:hypothetical protein PoMZ_08963 [Pyricularia oryzae]
MLRKWRCNGEQGWDQGQVGVIPTRATDSYVPACLLPGSHGRVWMAKPVQETLDMAVEIH